ncbi:MAG: amidohydrolase family protein [Methanobacteriaceae archaeon]|jgi:cytosine/adenosine deaminase-related metal-dependent hydrolase|nr:amidohydrolase family protein [Candidatus Methanorudis spinitermitis]
MITIINGIVLSGTELEPIKANILIDDGKILEISQEVAEGEIIDATNCIVCPSFLNAHTHIGDSIIKDEGDGKSIEEIVKPPNGIKHLAISNFSDEDLILAMENSMWEMLKTGTTHFIDYREGGVKGVKLLKKASKNIPISPIILGRDNIFFDEDPNLSKVKIAIRKLLKNCDGIAPSGFGEITDEVAILIAEKCEKQGKFSSIHAGEYEKLQQDSIFEFGKTEVERAIECGFDQLIHVTAPIKEDLDLIAKNNKNLVICPGSNAMFSNGFPPFLNILERKINPLIGTDNIMINSPNIFRELEYTLKSMRALYKNFIDPQELIKMPTSNPLLFNYFYKNQIDKNGDIDDDFNSLIKNNLNINKSIIEENSYCELMIVKKISKNPYLSLINRTEKNDIFVIINKDKVCNFNKIKN